MGNFCEVYRRERGGFNKNLPSHVTGAEFWAFIAKSMDAQNFPTRIVVCPTKGGDAPKFPLEASKIDYRGPAANVNPFPQCRPIAADRVGNHGREDKVHYIIKAYACDTMKTADFEAFNDSDLFFRVVP